MKYFVVLLLVFLAIIYFWPEKPKKQENKIKVLLEKESPKLVLQNEPRWKKWNRIREVSDVDIGVVLGDLESHIGKDHQYKDGNKITWAHEVSHGINALIRNQIYNKDGCNGFYVLQDRSIKFREPSINIRDVAKVIPEKLRGPSFNLYLVEQLDKWNDKPLYIMDEWIAFTNGSEVGKELNFNGWYYELLQAHNFNIYCMCLAMVIERDVSNYQDSEFKKFIMWNIERVFRVTLPSDRDEIDSEPPKKLVGFNSKMFCPHCRIEGNNNKIDLKIIKDYIDNVRTLPEAESLRKFSRNYFGDDWCKRIYGF